MTENELHAFKTLLIGGLLIAVGFALSALGMRSIAHAPGFAGMVCASYASMRLGALAIFQQRPRLLALMILGCSVGPLSFYLALVTGFDPSVLPIMPAGALLIPLCFSMQIFFGWLLELEPVPARHSLLMPLESWCHQHIQTCRDWAPVAIPAIGAIWMSAWWEIFEQPVKLARGVQWEQVLSDFIGIGTATLLLIICTRRIQQRASAEVAADADSPIRYRRS